MIVQLHDGREGELIGWVRIREPVPDAHGGTLTFGAAQIGVLTHVLPCGEFELLWEGVDRYSIADAQMDLVRAVALAGLCFWPDQNGRDLDLAPWTRQVYEQATVAEWRWRRSVENGATTNAGTQFAMNRLRKLVGGWWAHERARRRSSPIGE